ncbi:hypothetical protein FF1_014011 [Malus domestica]|uniref:uncharacterized protein LOC126600425 n=1 Tax=Malus sylvestris TaxID=3752 RepID=UPI0010AA70F0|nr:uncharacterized protein LOC103454225 [Malus domestica]XP_050122957.1 uncharacterized protein LOC126600425 [Malus sylvestris]
MGISKTAQRSVTIPLLPVSHSPSSSNPYISQPITSRWASKLVLVHRVLLFALGIVTLICVVMATSLVPQPPKIRLNSLFMSKLNISRGRLGANFDVTFTIENPNLVSWVRFNRLDGSISYKDNVILTYSLEPFVLGLKQQRTMRVKISTTGLEDDDQPVVEEWVLDEVKRQREDGAVELSMEMFAWATYKTGWWGTQFVIMNPQCLDLRVGFLPKVGFGSWISGGPMMCSVPVLID